MGETIRARVKRGVLEPLEPLGLTEGEEVTVTISPAPSKSDSDWLTHTAGGWAGLVDGEKLKRDVYESRSFVTRPEPRL